MCFLGFVVNKNCWADCWYYKKMVLGLTKMAKTKISDHAQHRPGG
jgi:hypothetical protein